jgi:hypothetical protein
MGERGDGDASVQRNTIRSVDTILKALQASN